MKKDSDSSPTLERGDLEDLLNRAATRLVQLTPGDLPGMAAVRKLLEQVLAAPAGPPAAVDALRSALALLDDVILDQVGLDAVIDRLGDLLQSALFGFDDESAPVLTEPAPAARPAPPASPHPAAAAPVDALPAEADRDLLPDFVEESLDYLREAEGALLALEADPADVEAINVVFRAFHTIKGTCAFLGLEPVSALAHSAESLLSRVRAGEIPFGRACADLSLRSIDLMKALVQGVSRRPARRRVAAPPDGHAELLRLLESPPLDGGALPAPADPRRRPRRHPRRSRAGRSPRRVRRRPPCACAPTASTAWWTWSASW